MANFRFIAPPLPHYIVGGEDTYEIGQVHPNRSSISVFDMVIVTKGALFFQEEDRQWSVKPGEALILHPDRRHFAYHPCTATTHFYWIHFQSTGEWTEVSEIVPDMNKRTKQLYQRIEEFPIHLPRFCSFTSPASAYEKLKTLLQLEGNPSTDSKWRQQAVFQSLLFDMNEKQKQQASPIERLAEAVETYLRQNYRNRVCYDDFRNRLHFHPTYITRCMKQIYGCTPLEYLTRYRVEQSKLLLVNTDMSIYTIAQEVGFSTSTYYIRCFVKIETVTPKHYRQRFRNIKAAASKEVVHPE
ncbi:AraC family transcriptional regulator [Paenibacillus mendelii]|uniref:AraC family transcriptional regulator n=1 Tax=Paenibacillus mendelii TaxID=206163 RepID=A0ABV6JEX7_9BACL|nr:helix-turn-helix domain-containing protein [Paenibacillus mendelii]MCQ6557344.1 AraC family transcriptional regulator [Paenibacillus mendelii]